MQTYANVFAQEEFIKWFILNKVCIFKTIFENDFQILFHKIFFSDFKGLFFKPYCYF
jgi:hypothetical protein